MNPLLALGIATGILLFLTLAKWPLRALRRKLLALSVVWALTFWFVRDDLPPQLALYLATPESVARDVALSRPDPWPLAGPGDAVGPSPRQGRQ